MPSYPVRMWALLTEAPACPSSPRGSGSGGPISSLNQTSSVRSPHPHRISGWFRDETSFGGRKSKPQGTRSPLSGFCLGGRSMGKRCCPTSTLAMFCPQVLILLDLRIQQRSLSCGQHHDLHLIKKRCGSPPPTPQLHISDHAVRGATHQGCAPPRTSWCRPKFVCPAPTQEACLCYS